MTKDSLTALVKSYYSNLQTIMKTLEQDQDIQKGEMTVALSALSTRFLSSLTMDMVT